MNINDYYAIVSQEGRKKFLIEMALKALGLLTTLAEDVHYLRSRGEASTIVGKVDIRTTPDVVPEKRGPGRPPKVW